MSSTYQSCPLRLFDGDILRGIIPTASRTRRISRRKCSARTDCWKLIQQEAPSGSHALEQKLLKAIEEFTQGMPQTDDITFMVVEKTPQLAASTFSARPLPGPS